VTASDLIVATITAKAFCINPLPGQRRRPPRGDPSNEANTDHSVASMPAKACGDSPEVESAYLAAFVLGVDLGLVSNFRDVRNVTHLWTSHSRRMQIRLALVQRAAAERQ
jgi:hypothetical protein